MAFQTGNRFWELRSKYGRDKLFASPELLWEAATEYFEWCEANPFIQIEFNGKDAIECELPKMRPFTIHALCLYLGCNTDYFKNFLNQERIDKDAFSPIITRIYETIYAQKFAGAASGFFNANIIARDLGLADKQDLNNNVSITDAETLKGIADKINQNAAG